MKKLLLLLLILNFIPILSQQTVTIPQIQGTKTHSDFENIKVKTSGVVTATFFESNSLDGFFMQDEIGDNNVETSDGIFVKKNLKGEVKVGDKIEITATVSQNGYRTQLIMVENVKIISSNKRLPITRISYNLNSWNWNSYEGMLIKFNQTLVVNSNKNLIKNGELELGVKRKMTSTNVELPGSAQEQNIKKENKSLPIILDDAFTNSYHTPILFADQNGTRRLGEKIDSLTAIVDYSYSEYRLYPAIKTPLFYGNGRTETHNNIGDYNLKICSFNLEFYLPTKYGKGFGASNEEEVKMQQKKIVSALHAIDADIYGLIEIEKGQDALNILARELNLITGTNNYTYINDGGKANNSYTKVGFIYRKDRVTPHKSLKSNNTIFPPDRKKAQAFTLNSNGEKFILSLNHFKSKRCNNATGANEDDGQGCYNHKRVEEAKNNIKFINQVKSYYGEEDVIVMGDLNSYGKEDPIITYTTEGYTDIIEKYNSPNAYSYVYRDHAGYLDHALANKTMREQITGATIFHINCDEEERFGYKGSNAKPNMYRCSDHDPVIVGLKLGAKSSHVSDNFEQKVKIFPTVVKDGFSITNGKDSIVQLYTVDGLLLLEKEIKLNNEFVSLSNLQISSKGGHILRVMGQGRVKNQIILIK